MPSPQCIVCKKQVNKGTGRKLSQALLDTYFKNYVEICKYQRYWHQTCRLNYCEKYFVNCRDDAHHNTSSESNPLKLIKSNSSSSFSAYSLHEYNNNTNNNTNNNNNNINNDNNNNNNTGIEIRAENDELKRKCNRLYEEIQALTASRECERNLIRNHLVPIIRIPYSQTFPISATPNRALTHIRIWFIQKNNTNSTDKNSHNTTGSESTFEHDMRRVLILESLQNKIICNEREADCQGGSPLSGVLTLPDMNERLNVNAPILTECFRNTVIFKQDNLDKDLNGTLVRRELLAYARLPSMASRYVVSMYFRAAAYSLPVGNPHSNRNSATVISTYLMKGQHRYHNTSSNNNLKVSTYCNNNDRETQGIIMERCVGDLNQVINMDRHFSEDMQVKLGSNANFTWQITEDLQNLVGLSNDKKFCGRPIFSDLCRATCQRLLYDLRSFHRIIHHFIHLCRALEYLHNNGIVHGDIKPQNIYVRIVKADARCVYEVELVLADFDFACCFPLKKSNDNNIVDWDKKITDKHFGTFGFHPAIYHSIVPLSYVEQEVRRYRTKPNDYNKNNVKNTAFHDYQRDYKIRYPYISRHSDTFSLGITMLLMLHSSSIFSDQLALWIKSQMAECNNKFNQDNICNPGHVLLYHQIDVINDITIGANPSFSTDKQRNKHFIENHQKVIRAVAQGIIPKSLCDLFERMTHDIPENRPSLTDCIACFQNVLNKT